jgi:hypothetical protein
MHRLRVGILDLVTHRTNDAWFERSFMLPNFASIMPQAVAAWAEELGCEAFYETYTGLEDLSSRLPSDLDVLFVSAFSRASFLAYAISNRYRQRGVITVLGGPHARSFPAHAARYFDYVCQLTDKASIRTLLQGVEHQARGVLVCAPVQPESLPSVEQRARFIDHNVAKNRGRGFVRTVPMLGSVGCPYSCTFCVDATIPYRSLPRAQTIEDLRFVEGRYGAGTIVFWHDPNFGVRFDEVTAIIEESGTSLMHGGESSLSLLSEEHLKAMQRNHWVVQVPGIESWNGFGEKGATGGASGREKVRRVADHVNLIMSYVPYVQANLVTGLDQDQGEEPFELTKAFLDLAPGVFPGFSMITDFHNAPFSAQLAAEGRGLSVPYPMLDNTSALNVRLKHYGLTEFLDRQIELQRYSWSARSIYRRLRANRGPYVKAVNLGRAFTEGGWRRSVFESLRRLVADDPSFQRHYDGAQAEAPQYFFDEIKRMLGDWAKWLPSELATPAGFLESERRAAAEPFGRSTTLLPTPETVDRAGSEALESTEGPSIAG